MRSDDPRHGTYQGYNAHRREPSELCGPCRQAGSEYNAQRNRVAESVPCLRCGVKRYVRADRAGKFCKDCKHFKFADAEPIQEGRWVRDGLIWRFEENWISWAERDAIRASWNTLDDTRQRAA